MRRGLSIAAAALLVGGVGACGGSGDSRESDLNDFIGRVNSMQQTAAPQFDNANRSYLAFSKGKLPTAAARRDLAHAEQSMRAMRDRIAALHAPNDAQRLKRGLVGLFDLDAALAHEATLLASFVPKAQDAAKPLPGLARRLSRGLKRSKTAKGQEAALSAYASGIGRVVGRLQPLHPPPLLLERHHAQIEHLESVESLGKRLVRALRAQDSKLVARLLLRFRRLAAAGPPSAVSSEALKGYGARYLAVQHAAQGVERERRRLERTLK